MDGGADPDPGRHLVPRRGADEFLLYPPTYSFFRGNHDFAEFYRDYEWMGAQRQIKVVGIFARLALRDGKQAYLDDQPQVLRLLLRTCRRYRELAPLAALIDELLPQPAQTGMTF